MAREFHFYNVYHYGDNILNLKFINNISEYLDKYNIIIHYYYNDTYVKNRGELERYINTPRIKINSIYNIPENSIHLWMGDKINNTDLFTFDTYYNLFYKHILSILHITDNICTSLYQKEEYLINLYKIINNKCNNKYKNIDILILNSTPQSRQPAPDINEFNKLCINLNKQYNICITDYIENDRTIKCTRDDYLKIQDIGAISTSCKYIIAIHSGPITACYNSYTKKNVIKWWIFGNVGIQHNEIDNDLNPSFESITNYFKSS